MGRNRWRLFFTASLACLASLAQAQPQPDAPVAQATATQPTAQGGASRAVVLAGGDRPLIVGTAELAGLELYDLDGRRVGAVDAGEAVGVDVRYDALALNGAPATILVAADSRSGILRFYRPGGGVLSEVTAEPAALGIAIEGACLYRSVQDGSLYAFALGDGGEIDQYLLFEQAPGRVGAKLVRRLHVPSTAEQCVADATSPR